MTGGQFLSLLAGSLIGAVLGVWLFLAIVGIARLCVMAIDGLLDWWASR